MIDLPRISVRAGNLTFVEGARHVPFNRACVLLYDVPGGETRAGHALETFHQFSSSRCRGVRRGRGMRSHAHSLPAEPLPITASTCPEDLARAENFSSGSVSWCLLRVLDASGLPRD